MEDSKIPVEIEVRLDERSVGVSMDALKAKVKTQGREIGKSLSGAFSDISFMSDAVMKAEREKDKFLKKQLDADRTFNNAIRSEAKKTSDSQLSLIKQQEAAMWASYEVEKSGKKALEDHKVSLAKKAAAEQLALIKQQEAAMWASYEKEKAGIKALNDYKAVQAKKAAQESSMFVGPQLPKTFSTDNLMQGVVTGNQDAIRSMAKLQEEGNKMNAVFGQTPTILGYIDGRLRGIALLTTELTRAFFGLSLAVGAVGAPAIFGTGYLKSIEDAKMGLVGTLVTMGKFTEGTDKFQAALGLANDTIKSLEVNALRFGIPLDEILNVFRAITASGLQAGMTLEQIGKAASIGTVAVRALGLDARQSVQELRDLFMGGIMPASSTLATSLGLRDSDIKKAKADAKAGIKDFYDFIMEQLQGYELVAAERTNTLSGSMDLLGMKLQRLFANEGVFTSIKDAVKGVSNSIAELDKNTNQLKFNQQLMDQLYQYNAIISKVVGWMGSLAEATLNNINHVAAFISSIALAATTMGKWGILTILIGWLKGIGAAYTAASTQATAYSLAHSAAMTKVVATTKGVQAATLAAAGKTGLIGLAFFALYEAADMMGLLDGIFGRFEQRVDQARQKVKQMTTLEKQERLSVVDQNLKVLGTKSVEGYDPYSLFNDFKHAAKKAAVSKETGKVVLEEEYNQLRDWQKAEYGQLESIQTLMRVMNAEREGIVEEIQKAMKPASVKLDAGGVGAFMKGSDALLKGSDFEKMREAESKMNSLLLQMQQGAVELDELYKKRINSNDLEKLNDREEQAKEIRSRIQAMADERRKIEESMNKSEKIKVDPSIARAQKDALKDALTAENIFAEKQDTLVQEGAKTYIEAYNDKIAKIKEFAEKNGESIKWEERRNEAYKTVSDYLTQHNVQLNKESEQREANTTATLKYGAAVETSGAALLMEQYAREGFLSSGFKELALISVLAQSRNDLSKIHEKSVKEQIDSQKELDELVAESSLIFLENEKQKSEFKMQETLKRINAEREEAKKSLELNLKLRMNAGPLSPQEYENYLKTKEAIDKSFMDREETTRKIFNQRVKNAELKDAKETVDKIEGTFKEAFMNIAENGVSGWRSMLNKFKSDFKKNIIEYIYKEFAKPFVLKVIASVTGAMGMSGVSQAASRMVEGSYGGGGMNLFSMADPSNWSGGMSPFEAWDTLGDSYETFSNLTESGLGMFDSAKIALDGTGKAFGSLASYASAVFDVANGSYGKGVGSAIGTMFGGPVGGMIGSFIGDKVLGDDLGGLVQEAGGPQQGQYGTLDAKGYKSSFTMSGGDALGNQALAEVAYGQAANLLKMAGKDIAGLTIGQGYKLDPEGSAAGLAYRNISLNGRTVTGGTFDGNNGAQWVGGNSDGAGAANYLGKLTNEEIRKLVDAIGDSGLSETIEKLSANFTDLNDAIGKYTVAQAQQKALLSVVMTEDEKKTLQLADAQKVLDSTFASLGMSVPSTAAGFRDLINGLDLTTKAGQDALTKLSDVSGAYLTVANNAVELANKAAEEAKAAQQEQYGWQIKLDIAQGKYTEQQADRFSIWNAAANDSTRAIISQVWALEDQKVALEAQKVATDAATESLKKMQDVAMEGVDNAFGELVSAYESEISAKESLIDKTKDYIRQLKDFSQSLALGELSTLDPLGKYQAAKSAFDVVSQRAMSGDSAAIEQLQGVSEAYLQASREYYASNVQYADDYNKVQSAISKTVNVAEQQVSSMDAQLITMRQQLSSLTQINESTKSVESAITRLQTALLEAVRVGNIGDVSEQAKTASGLIKGGAGELYNPLTDTWGNKGQSATTSQIRDWGAKILNEQGPMALYEATKSVGLSMSSVNVIAGWKAGTAEDWAKANNLPTFANGGFVKPGWAMVGERGPELVNFATQARVYTADQTSRMVSGSGDNEVYLQQVIAELQALIRQNGAASQAMIAELQQVKAELEDLRSRTRLRDGTNG